MKSALVRMSAVAANRQVALEHLALIAAQHLENAGDSEFAAKLRGAVYKPEEFVRDYLAALQLRANPISNEHKSQPR